MPLSEHEQQQLEQMERALYAQDPRFASRLQHAGGKGLARRRIAIGVLGALIGLGLVLIGTAATVWLGAAGFALMVASVDHALAPPRWRAVPDAHTHSVDR